MLLDALYRLAYRCAYQLARLYWRLARPKNHGALVMLWHQGRLLVIKNSYVSYFSLPGGYVKPSESAREAAVRELTEEIHLVIPPGDLRQVLDHTHLWEGRQDHVIIFEAELAERPEIRVDNREVVAAEWLSPEEALKRRLFRPMRGLIEARPHGPVQATPS